MGAEAGAPVVDDPARLDEQLLAVHGEVVGVGKLPAAVDVLVLAVDELAEEAFVPKLLQVHVLLCERVVLEEVVDLAGALDGLDQADALGWAAEGRHLAHDVLAPVQGLDGVGRVAREVGGDEDGVDVLREELVLVRRDEGAGDVPREARPHLGVDVAAGDHVDVEELRGADEVLPAAETPDAEADPAVGVEYLFHGWDSLEERVFQVRTAYHIRAARRMTMRVRECGGGAVLLYWIA